MLPDESRTIRHLNQQELPERCEEAIAIAASAVAELATVRYQLFRPGPISGPNRPAIRVPSTLSAPPGLRPAARCGRITAEPRDAARSGNRCVRTNV